MLAQAAPATKAQSLALLYGETLGAAALCPAVTPARIDALTTKASAHVKILATGAADATAAGGQLVDAIARGRAQVETGAETCAQAESEFDQLERELGG
jgi:2-methylisocitrate lyase-like PEP mutase family enzyme